MTADAQALLMVGSPRGSKSTSSALGTYLMNQLEKRGMKTNAVHIHKSLRTEEGREELLSAVERSDLIILAFPLYVDTLPAQVIEALELIRKRQRTGERTNEQRLLALVNSGFPEPEQNHIALENCKVFASESGMEWVGGLAIGGGESIDGQALEDVKGMARRVIRALELTAEALDKGDPIPNEALELTSKPLVPKWMYLLLGNMGWKRKAKKNGVKKKKMYDTPYAK